MPRRDSRKVRRVIEVLFWLVVAHYIIDVLLQHADIARQKNPHSKPPKAYIPEVHGPLETTWPYYMMAHAASHAVGVGVVTGRTELAIAELLAHCAVDTTKSYFRLSTHLDQAAHMCCKVAWVLYLAHVGLI